MKTRRPVTAVAPDLSYLQAVPILLPQGRHICLVLVGTGGTGSWLAPSLARLVRVLKEAGREISLTFVDPDIVEAGNVPRQNFCYAEIGQPKAVALATRYSAAWGIEIHAITRSFERSIVSNRHNELVILVGCVDNAAARQELAKHWRPGIAGQSMSLQPGGLILGTRENAAKCCWDQTP